MNKKLQIGNICALLITIFVNYGVNAGLLNGRTVGEVSAQYSSLFTPAGYTFAIWGLIYLALTSFVYYQSRPLYKPVSYEFITQIGPWFMVSCAANCLWIISWVMGYTALSVLIIGLLFWSLLRIVLNTNMERWDAPFPIIFFVWWPFCLYSGWVTVAVIANISAWLVKIGWNGWGLDPAIWAIGVIIAAGSIALAITWRRNMREFAGTVAWGLGGVLAANWGQQPAIVWTAGITIAVILLSAAVHGFQNRHTAPHIKFMQMRQS